MDNRAGTRRSIRRSRSARMDHHGIPALTDGSVPHRICRSRSLRCHLRGDAARDDLGSCPHIAVRHTFDLVTGSRVAKPDRGLGRDPRSRLLHTQSLRNNVARGACPRHHRSPNTSEPNRRRRWRRPWTCSVDRDCSKHPSPGDTFRGHGGTPTLAPGGRSCTNQCCLHTR